MHIQNHKFLFFLWKVDRFSQNLYIMGLYCKTLELGENTKTCPDQLGTNGDEKNGLILFFHVISERLK
jgi:hypothetical protein